MIPWLISLVLILGVMGSTAAEEQENTALSRNQALPLSRWNQNSNQLPASHHYQNRYDSDNVNNEIIAFLGHRYIESPGTTPEPRLPPPPPIRLPVVNRPLQVRLRSLNTTSEMN